MHRLSILISLGLALTACSANQGDEGIFISKAVSPGTGCSVSASPSELFLPHGTVSTLGNGYRIFPQMVSKITATEKNIESRTIQVRGARVDIEVLDPDLKGISGSAIRFESRFSAPIAPNGGITDAEFVGISKEFLDAVVAVKGAAPFSSEVIVHAVVFGDLAGSEVTSQDWEFPVTVCNNCVVNSRGMCPLPFGTPVTDSRGACSLFQDGYVDCCTTMMTKELVCPAIVGAQYAITVGVVGTMSGTATTPGTGTVTATGINCPGDCDELYNQGTMVTLTATATAATVVPIGTTTFAGWTGNCAGTGACTVTMDAAKNVTATFNHNAP